MRYSFESCCWDQRERHAIEQALVSGCPLMGKQVAEFERAFACQFGVNYAVMVNSDASASLLSVAALCYTKRRQLRPADEVIVPAVINSTAVFALHQCGLRAKFVDVDPQTIALDVTKVASAVTPATKAILASNPLGGACDYDKLIGLCDQHQLALIEDNTQSLGATYKGKYCGTFGRCGAFSLNEGSHLSTGEGGVVVTNDEELYHILLALRSYGSTEHLPNPNKIDSKKSDRVIDDPRFLLPGYNVRPSEIIGAVGLVQLEKLPALLATRKNNARVFQEVFKDFAEVSLQAPLGDSSWLAFGLVLRESAAGKRDGLTDELARLGVEVRPLICGNITSHPVMSHLQHAIHGTLPQAKKIDKQGLLIANSPVDLTDNIVYLRKCLESSLSKALVTVIG